MTPEQFFDELDKLFGCDDGYVNHLQRIKEVIKSARTQWERADSTYEHNGELIEQVEKLEEQNKKLKWKLIETQGALAFQQEYVDGDKEALKKENKELQNKIDVLIISRNQGQVKINELEEQVEELKEQVEDAHQKGYDAGREEYQVDQEFLDEKDKEIEELKEQACDYVSMRKHRDTLLEESEETFMKVHNLEEELKVLQEKYDHLRSVHSKVVQDLNARTEKVIEMTLQQQ